MTLDWAFQSPNAFALVARVAAMKGGTAVRAVMVGKAFSAVRRRGQGRWRLPAAGSAGALSPLALSCAAMNF